MKYTRFKYWTTLSIMLLIFASAQSKNKIKVACVGNSIVAGAGIADSYPAQLQVLLGNNYTVTDFSEGNATLLKKGNNPYGQSLKYKQALVSEPDIVFIELGMNDSKAINRLYLTEFIDDYDALIKSFQQLSSHPRIILLLPLPSFKADNYSASDPAIKGKIVPFIQGIAYQDSVEVIDLYSLLIDKSQLFPDGIYPNREGTALVANRLYELLKQDRELNFDISKNLPAAEKTSSFYGYTCVEFTFKGRNCKVVQPKWTAKGHPWIWKARFWGVVPQVDIALLERGFHLVYCNAAELYGNKESVKLWDDFYLLVNNAGLANKAAMEGASRGGVYVYNWAAENQKKVACVYLDNPVLDLKSWPGAKGKGPGSKGDWDKVKIDFDLKTPEQEEAFAESPIHKVAQIVKGRFPMLHVLADADEVVPPEENTLPFEQKVKALGGNIAVIHKSGFHHHPHGLPNPTPIVNFILKNTGVAKK